MAGSGKIVVWEGRNGRFYWKHVSRNGREDNGAEQGYARRRYARKKGTDRYPAAVVVDLPKGEKP